MKLCLKQDIVKSMNANASTIYYDLPYVFKTNELEDLYELVENAPIAYSLEFEESPCYPNGLALRLKRLED